MSVHKSLGEALAAFQAEAPIVPKGKTATVPTKSGGSYSYSYADLADVAAATYPRLAEHGLSFSCLPRQTDHGYELAGRLMHVSGDSIEGALPLFGSTPQELGSALTYMRRYLLGSLTGVVTDEDDDAQAAQQQPTRAYAPASPNRQASEAQITYLKNIAQRSGVQDAGAFLDWLTDKTGRTITDPSQLSAAEAHHHIERSKQ